MVMKSSRKDFLEALFGEYFAGREGFIMVRASRRLDPRISTRFFPNIEILAKEQYNEDQNVFFSVCCREGMKTERQYVQYITALWAGLDFTADGYSGKSHYFANKAHAAKAVRSFPLPPSIIVESGWGVHLYWLLTEMTPVTDIDKIERILAKINTYFRCTSPVKIDSVLRLPGTFNCRMPGELAKCHAKYLNADFRYELEAFEKMHIGTNGPEVMTGPALRAPTNIVTLNDITEVVESMGEPDIDEAEEEWGQSLWEPPSPNVSRGGSTHASGNRRVQVLRDETPASNLDSESRTKRTSELPGVEAAQTDVVEAEELSDALADEIVDKVVERLSEKLVDQLADEIVARLFKLLSTNGPK